VQSSSKPACGRSCRRRFDYTESERRAFADGGTACSVTAGPDC
jgi:hypothetical protein